MSAAESLNGRGGRILSNPPAIFLYVLSFSDSKLGSDWGEEVKKWQKAGIFMGFLPVFGQFSGYCNGLWLRHSLVRIQLPQPITDNIEQKQLDFVRFLLFSEWFLEYPVSLRWELGSKLGSFWEVNSGREDRVLRGVFRGWEPLFRASSRISTKTNEHNGAIRLHAV